MMNVSLFLKISTALILPALAGCGTVCICTVYVLQIVWGENSQRKAYRAETCPIPSAVLCALLKVLDVLISASADEVVCFFFKHGHPSSVREPVTLAEVTGAQERRQADGP